MLLENINKEVLVLAKKANNDLQDIFKQIDDICLINSNRILSAFIDNKVSYSDFMDINGYGNYDPGRDKLEKIFAQVLGCKDALVRPHIMSGTTALYLTFSALLKHDDILLSITGTPYDSLQEMIYGDSSQSLKANGIRYAEISLLNDDFDTKAIIDYLKNNKVKVIEIQRSRGYSQRASLNINKIEKIIKEIRKINKEVVIVVDNCYGELVEDKEPGHVGADLVVGSLMKNLGGGIAASGGYIAGNTELIEMIADRLSAPGIGKQLGANFNLNNEYFKGIFLAPNAVKNALKTAIFSAYVLEKLGYNNVSPKYNEERTDIIQTVQFNNAEQLVEFAQGLQASSPIDSYVKVLPSAMPGYPNEEVMACGSFTQGSTIELSGDAPVIEPYVFYMQGGLTYEYGQLSIMSTLTKLMKY